MNNRSGKIKNALLVVLFFLFSFAIPVLVFPEISEVPGISGPRQYVFWGVVLLYITGLFLGGWFLCRAIKYTLQKSRAFPYRQRDTDSSVAITTSSSGYAIHLSGTLLMAILFFMYCFLGIGGMVFIAGMMEKGF